MRWVKKSVLWIVMGLMLFCFSATAMASSERAAGIILSEIQGQWYDEDGKVILNFQGNTLNGCPITGIYDAVLGNMSYGGNVRIVEATGYRDIPIVCSSIQKIENEDSYHFSILLHSDNPDISKHKLLLKTPTPRYYETIGGIGLDMPAKKARELYGKAEQIFSIKDKYGSGKVTYWIYNKLGFVLAIRYNRIYAITIWKAGDRRFDNTGFNCTNRLDEFQHTYGLNETLKQGWPTGYYIGHGEYLWFDDYPKTITLSLGRHSKY